MKNGFPGYRRRRLKNQIRQNADSVVAFAASDRAGVGRDATLDDRMGFTASDSGSAAGGACIFDQALD
jgi:hypothetical protein